LSDKMAVYVPASGGDTMPEFTTVSVQEAHLRTIPGRQGMFMNEYVAYIQQLSAGQAGRLRLGEGEKHPTIRRHLVSAATALGISLIIRRSGNDLYFWKEDGQEDQPRPRRGRRPRTERPGSLIPSNMLIPEPAEDRGSLPTSPPEGDDQVTGEEITPPDQPVDELGMVEQGIPSEESPELG
jgi:hypothetical protein